MATGVCVICWSDFGESPILCSDPACDNPICTVCLSQVIDLSLKESILPVCPINGCNGYFDYKILAPQDLRKYGRACLQYFDKQKDDIVSFRVAKNDIISKIRKERVEYLVKNFPKGIYLIAKICTPSKLARINTKKYLNTSITNPRKCMNTGCQGLLNEKLVCSFCSTKFCKECEKRIREGHICNSDDKASIELLNDTRKCPNCNAAIHKTEGCNFMTCSACEQKFTYNDGKVSKHGSHNAAIVLTNPNPTVFGMSEYISKTSNPNLYKRLIMEIESSNTSKPTDTIILRVLKKYRMGENVEKSYMDMVKAFDKYSRVAMRYRRYISHLNEIETNLVRGELTLDLLNTIHAIYYK